MVEPLVEVKRSGWSERDWPAGDFADLWTLLLIPFWLSVNLFTHFVVFRGGWMVHVFVDGTPPLSKKIRYRRKRLAVADLELHRAEAAAYAALHPKQAEEAVRLPTRGGRLRRPW